MATLSCLLSVPQGAASFRDSLTLDLVGIFFVVSKYTSSCSLWIFLLVDLPSGAVQKSSVQAAVLYSSIFVILVLRRRQPEAVFRVSEPFRAPLYLFSSSV